MVFPAFEGSRDSQRARLPGHLKHWQIQRPFNHAAVLRARDELVVLAMAWCRKGVAPARR